MTAPKLDMKEAVNGDCILFACESKEEHENYFFFFLFDLKLSLQLYKLRRHYAHFSDLQY